MPDAQPRSSLNQTAVMARQGFVRLSRSIANYVGLTLLVVAALVWSVPDLRAQVVQFHSQLTTAKSVEVDTDLATNVAVDFSHSRTVAFLGSMGDGLPVEKLPAIKVSSVQVESLGRYITRKYRVSNEATRMLISTAYGVGQEMGIDPLLLLAIIAIESSFNPFAESHVGAQGLMQVLTRVHVERFEPFGGVQAAWNPVANIRVGASILKEYVERGGSLVAGLRMYVGVGPNGTSPYGDKVLAERRRLASAAGVPAELPGGAPARSASAAPAVPMSLPGTPAVSLQETAPTLM